MPRAFCTFLLACIAMAQIRQAPPPSHGTGGTGGIEGIVSDATSHAPLKNCLLYTSRCV